MAAPLRDSITERMRRVSAIAFALLAIAGSACNQGAAEDIGEPNCTVDPEQIDHGASARLRLVSVIRDDIAESSAKVVAGPPLGLRVDADAADRGMFVATSLEIDGPERVDRYVVEVTYRLSQHRSTGSQFFGQQDSAPGLRTERCSLAVTHRHMGPAPTERVSLDIPIVTVAPGAPTPRPGTTDAARTAAPTRTAGSGSFRVQGRPGTYVGDCQRGYEAWFEWIIEDPSAAQTYTIRVFEGDRLFRDRSGPFPIVSRFAQTDRTWDPATGRLRVMSAAYQGRHSTPGFRAELIEVNSRATTGEISSSTPPYC